MTTAGQLIDRVNSELLAGTVEERNKLAASTDSSQTDIEMTYSLGSLRDNTVFQIGTELMYVWEVNTTSKTATVRSEPEHDWSSHYADAMRVWAEADMNGMLAGKVGRSGGGDDDDWFMRGKRKRTAPVLRGFGRRLLRR